MTGAPTIARLLTTLGERAPWVTAGGWDPVGLQIGDPEAPVERLALCHEVTEQVVSALERAPVDLLVSYHPLLFEPARRLLAGPTPGGRAHRLIRSGVAVAVAHTNFDVARGGAADALADALELRECSGFGPLRGPETLKIATFVPEGDADRLLEAVAGAGAGAIGNYTHCSFRAAGLGSFYATEATSPVVGQRGALNLEPEVRIEFVAPRARESEVLAALVAAHPYEEPAFDVYERHGDARLIGRLGRPPEGTTLGALAARVCEALGSGVTRVGGDPDRVLERVAVLPGAGADFLRAAAGAGAEAVVTGDLSHHRAREALDRGLCLVDPGHAATERPGLKRLEGWLRELGPKLVSLLELDPDPWAGTGA